MATDYDINNTFARIIRKELPAKIVAENEYAMSFHDIHPLAPVHVLVIPKLEASNLHEFTAMATPAQAKGFFNVISETVQALGLTESNYNIFASTGVTAGQEIFHFHLHIISGKSMQEAIAL